MDMHVATSSDDTERYPETVADTDNANDTRQTGREAEDPDQDEAGYGYGV